MAHPPSAERPLLIHVDADNLWIYEQEYGLPPSLAYDLIYQKALPDLTRLLESGGLRGTFFIVGKDLDLAPCREFCRQAVASGHEIANHTFSHPVDLHRMSRKSKEFEIRECDERITHVTNKKPVGFRAPGYYLDRSMLEILARTGYLYDSSVLPGCANMLMKWYLQLNGRSRLDKAFGRACYVFASRQVRRIADSSHPAGGLLEIPITVLPWIRMPIHSTFVYALGSRYFDLSARMLRASTEPLVLLFHAIDLLDIPATLKDMGRVPALTWRYEERLTLARRMLQAFPDRSCITSEELSMKLAHAKVASPGLITSFF